MTTLIMVAILLFGIFAYKSLPMSDLPNIDYPTITVDASQPGGSPEYMATLIATPLERNFANISGLNSLTSSNSFGSTEIVLNFDLDVDLNSKEVEVAQAINATQPNLPVMPTNPTYEKFNPADTPIIFMILTTNTQTLADLYETGYNLLAQPISMIKGISRVQIYGFSYAVRVQADPMKLMARKIDLNTLASTLTNANPNLPSGVLQGQYENLSLNSFGMLNVGEAYNEVVILQEKGSPLFVGDVAEGLSALSSRDPYFHYITPKTDQYTVVLAISRLPNSNTLEISNAIQKKLPILTKAIPGSMNLSIFYDKAGPILDSVEDVEITLLIALLLVVTVIFIYLGKFAETIIPSLVLPMSIIATFIIMLLLGFNLDTLSLLALTLAVGFIVDDSIVVLENIVRHIEGGKIPFEAALAGSKQISTTVFTMTIALSAVFIPFIWMPGILGRIFHEFSLTIVFAILCSGFISLTLNPMLCSHFLKSRPAHKKPSFSDRVNRALVGKYEWLLRHSIFYRKIILLVGIASLVLSFLLLKILKADFLPPGNLSILQGIHLLQEGSSKINTTRHLIEVNEIIRKNPYQDGFISIGHFPSDDRGAIYIRLVNASDRPSATEVARQIEQEVSQQVGIDTFLRPLPLINLQVGATSSLGDYQYILTSNDQKALYAVAEAFTIRMMAMPELVNVNSDMRAKSPQINLSIDRDRAGIYGITAQAIESTLQFAYSGGRISTFSKGTNLYDLIVEVAPGFDLAEEDLDLLYIRAPSTGELVPLSAVATWQVVPAAASISHLDTFPAVTISFSLGKKVALSTVLTKLDQLAAEILPGHVQGKIQGSGEVFLETFRSLRWLIIIAIIIIYLLLGILYESFIHPITVLSALPVATLGGLLTLWLFNLPMSLFSIVGVIVLIGIVQKNGIMMIDFALDYLQKPGKSAEQAIIEACKARFRPIIMTTLAAMMGALPVVIGIGVNAETNRPLGLVVFGGLLFSQLITLFLTPVVFLYMHDFQEWVKRRGRGPSG
jgi:hydrophobic/amphiphilic exporter-1 (mainly G- bacteria), HAE1 family